MFDTLKFTSLSTAVRDNIAPYPPHDVRGITMGPVLLQTGFVVQSGVSFDVLFRLVDSCVHLAVGFCVFRFVSWCWGLA